MLKQFRKEMGLSVFSAQYQQDPTPPGGNRMRWEWFGTYDTMLARDAYQFIVQSWDTGLTAEPTSDYSVGQTWGFHNDCWHLLDVVRERLDFPDLKRRVQGLADSWNAGLVLIEHAGSGIPLVQQLRADGRPWRYRSIIPRLDKRTRFEAQTGQLETRRYHIPAQASWLSEFRKELLAFPAGRYDDQVDSLVQFVELVSSLRGMCFLDHDPVTGRRLGRTRRLRVASR